MSDRAKSERPISNLYLVVYRILACFVRLGLHEPGAPLRDEDVVHVRHTILDGKEEWYAPSLGGKSQSLRFFSDAVAMSQDHHHSHETVAHSRKPRCFAARHIDGPCARGRSEVASSSPGIFRVRFLPHPPKHAGLFASFTDPPHQTAIR